MFDLEVETTGQPASYLSTITGAGSNLTPIPIIGLLMMLHTVETVADDKNSGQYQAGNDSSQKIEANNWYAMVVYG